MCVPSKKEDVSHQREKQQGNANITLHASYSHHHGLMELVPVSVVTEFCSRLRIVADNAKDDAKSLSTTSVESTVLHLFLDELRGLVGQLEAAAQRGVIHPDALEQAELACAKHEAEDVKQENTFLRGALQAEGARLKELLWRFSKREQLFAEVKSHALRQTTRSASGCESASQAAVPFELLEALDAEVHRMRQWFEQRNASQSKSLEVSLRKQRDAYEKRLEAKEKEIVHLQLRYRDSLAALQAAHASEMTRLSDDRRDLRILLTDTEQLAIQRAEAFCGAKYEEKLQQVRREFTEAMDALRNEQERATRAKVDALERLSAMERVLSDTARHAALLQASLHHVVDVELPNKLAAVSTMSTSELETLREANSGAHQRLLAVELELAAAREQFSHQKQQLESDIAGLTSQLQQSRNETQHKDMLLREATAARAQLQAQIQNLQKLEIQLQTELEFLRRASGGTTAEAFKKLLEQVEADHDQRLVQLTEELTSSQEKLQAALEAKIDLSERLRLSEGAYQSCDAERTDFRNKSNKLELRLQEMKDQYDSVQTKLREVQKSLVEERTNSIVGGSLHAPTSSSSGLLRAKSSRQLGSLAASRNMGRSMNSGTFDDDEAPKVPTASSSSAGLRRVASTLKRATSFRPGASANVAANSISGGSRSQLQGGKHNNNNNASHDLNKQQQLVSPTGSDGNAETPHRRDGEFPKLTPSTREPLATSTGSDQAPPSFGATLTVPGGAEPSSSLHPTHPSPHHPSHFGSYQAFGPAIDVMAASAVSTATTAVSNRRTSVRFSIVGESDAAPGLTLATPGGTGFSFPAPTDSVSHRDSLSDATATAQFDGADDAYPGMVLNSPGLEGAGGTWQSLFPAVELPVATQRTGPSHGDVHLALPLPQPNGLLLRTPNVSSSRSSFSGMIPTFIDKKDAEVQTVVTGSAAVGQMPTKVSEPVVRVRERIIHGAATPISADDRRVQAQLRHELTAIYKEIGFLELQVRSLHAAHPLLGRFPSPWGADGAAMASTPTPANATPPTVAISSGELRDAVGGAEDGSAGPWWTSSTKSCEAHLLELEPLPFTDISHKKEVLEMNLAMGDELARRRDLMKRLQEQLQHDLALLKAADGDGDGDVGDVTNHVERSKDAAAVRRQPAPQCLRTMSPNVERVASIVPVLPLTSAVMPPSRTVLTDASSLSRKVVVSGGSRDVVSPRLPSPAAMLQQLQESLSTMEGVTSARSAGGPATLRAHPPHLHPSRIAAPARPASARAQLGAAPAVAASSSPRRKTWRSSGYDDTELVDDLRDKISSHLEPQTYFCVGHAARDSRADGSPRARPMSAAVCKAPKWSSSMSAAGDQPPSSSVSGPTMRVVSSAANNVR